MTAPSLKILPNSIRHSILSYLSKRECAAFSDMHSTFRVWVPGMGDKVFKTNVLEQMQIAELIEVDPATDEWFITSEGRERLYELDSKVSANAPNLTDIVRNNLFVPTGTYDGKDLRRNSTRPGAYNAYAIPSKTAWKDSDDAPPKGQ